jgi:hypothetical protein
MESSLAVRRADGASISSAKRSVKIWRPHRTASQRKRRAITRSCTIRPESGRSVTRRRYTGYGHVGRLLRTMDTDQRFRTLGPQ